MATRSRSDVPVTQSLLDRLTDYEDWPNSRATSLRMFREGIKRDVEWLLNTRRPKVSEVEGYPLAESSVFNFGLPDFNDTPGEGGDPEKVLALILQVVRTYEPRIGDPRVTLSRTDELNRSLRFHVEGVLRMETGDEEISFDTVLEVTSGEYEVK